MPRPSQCGMCLLYEGCLHPESILCAEKLERDEIERRRKEREVPKARQQYSTPDGSVWEAATYSREGVEFMRVYSPDGAHENDFRPQKLVEVIKTWGPLSLHDPYAVELDLLKAAIHEAVYNSEVATYAQRIQTAFRKLGMRLVTEAELND